MTSKLEGVFQFGSDAPLNLEADGLTDIEYHEMENAIINATSDMKQGSIKRALGVAPAVGGTVGTAVAGYRWTKDGAVVFDSIGGNKYGAITDQDFAAFVACVRGRLARCKGASKIK